MFSFSSNRTFRHLRESLAPIQKFQISPRVSYTHSDIMDISMGLLHPHRNSGYLHGSLTPIQKFWISSRVSYTHLKILDISTGLLHPYRTFRILPRVSFTLIPGFSPEGINDPLLASPNTHYLLFIGRSPKDKPNPHSPRVVNVHTVHPHPT